MQAWKTGFCKRLYVYLAFDITLGYSIKMAHKITRNHCLHIIMHLSVYFSTLTCHVHEIVILKWFKPWKLAQSIVRWRKLDVQQRHSPKISS